MLGSSVMRIGVCGAAGIGLRECCGAYFPLLSSVVWECQWFETWSFPPTQVLILEWFRQTVSGPSRQATKTVQAL